MKKLTNIFLITLLFVIGIFSENITAQTLGEKVYWMSTIEVPLGKLGEYHKFNGEELAPLMQKHGYKQVATWQTIVGDIEEVITVSEFANMAAYHEARRSLLGSDEWKSASKKFGELSRSIKSRFLSAAPYSTLK